MKVKTYYRDENTAACPIFLMIVSKNSTTPFELRPPLFADFFAETTFFQISIKFNEKSYEVDFVLNLNKMEYLPRNLLR